MNIQWLQYRHKQQDEGRRQYARPQSRTQRSSLPRAPAWVCQGIVWFATQQWFASANPAQWSCQSCSAKHVAVHMESHLKVSYLFLFGILHSGVCLFTLLIEFQSPVSMVKFGQFHSASDSKSISAQSLCKSDGGWCSLNTCPNIWPDLLKLQIFAAVLAGGSSFQDGQPDTSHLRYLQLITFFWTFYKIHKPLLGRTDTASKSQEIEFSGVEFVEFNQVVKYLSGGRGGRGTICQDNKVLPYHVSPLKVARSTLQHYHILCSDVKFRMMFCILNLNKSCCWT